VIRVVLVDDQDLVRAGLERILGTEDDLAIVAQCADGAQALVAVEEHRPDVVVMDIRMRVMNGIDATRRIRDAGGPPVLILTTFDDDETLWSAIDAGAAGFVLKDAPAVDLIRAVRTVASGAAWLDPQVTPRVLAIYRTTVLPQAREQERAAQLTEREHEVLRLIAGGATNAEIASSLHVSAGTVKSHVGSIFTKLGVRDRPGAIVYAYQHGIASPPGPT
jgi:DNA-binding NarL/FixJ family response regulator